MSEFRWEDIADQWREAFKQPEVESLLDEHMLVLLAEASDSDAVAASRGAINTILRLQSVPEIARAKRHGKPPVVQSAQSWRQRLLLIIRKHYPSAEEF